MFIYGMILLQKSKFLSLIQKCKKLFSKLNECTKLGEGVYGEVFKANVCNIDVALKVIINLI